MVNIRQVYEQSGLPADDFDEVMEKQDKLKEEDNMTETVKGVVERINKNAGGFYGVKIGEDWFGAGKFEPKFSEGDEVSFEYSSNGKYKNMEFKTVTVLEKGAGKADRSSSSGSSTAAPTNWDLKDKRITYLASRKDAIELARLAIDKDAIILPTKKQDRLEVIVALVDELTGTMYQRIYGEEFTGE